MRLSVISTFFLTLLLAGCNLQQDVFKSQIANVNKMLAEKGSPYRVKIVAMDNQSMATTHVLAGTPGPSIADDVLKQDIMNLIKNREKQLNKTGELKLREFRQLEPRDGKFIESWVFDREGNEVVYVVTMAPSPQGGVDFEVAGPWE